jgi:hypothetical protein
VMVDFCISPLPGGGIKTQVQFKNVAPRLSPETPLPSLRMPGDEFPHRFFAHAARPGNARDLELSPTPAS